MKSVRTLGAVVALTVVLAGCAGAGPGSTPAATSAPTTESAAASVPNLNLTSTSIPAGEAIPGAYSCVGANTSPELSWDAVPETTATLAVILDDPDAVEVVGYVYDHWVLFNIPAGTTSLPEGLPSTGALPDGSIQGTNSSNSLGYDGPCPPGGDTHEYVFTLYAVDITLDLTSTARAADVLEAIDGHVVAQGQLKAPFTGR